MVALWLGRAAESSSDHTKKCSKCVGNAIVIPAKLVKNMRIGTLLAGAKYKKLHMNAKVFYGLIAFAGLAAYHIFGIDIRYLVYVLIMMMSIGLGAWVDAIGDDEE